MRDVAKSCLELSREADKAFGLGGCSRIDVASNSRNRATEKAQSIYGYFDKSSMALSGVLKKFSIDRYEKSP